jgi:hypothetical protein
MKMHFALACYYTAGGDCFGEIILETLKDCFITFALKAHDTISYPQMSSVE